MRGARGLRGWLPAALAGLGLLSAGDARAIEMFTYFGDGSRIGLPSLEVPIEAYPGIPLRSDRIRARRAGRVPPRGTVGRFRGRSAVPAGEVLRMQPAPALRPWPANSPEVVPAPVPEPSGINPLR